MAVASAELAGIFKVIGVSGEMSSLVTAKGVVTTATFANSCGVKDTFLAGTASASDLVQIACLKQAWREAGCVVEQELTCTMPDLTSLENLGSALPQTVQLRLETDFMQRYSWLRIPSKSIGCDCLLDGICIEFDRNAPSICQVLEVRSRAKSSLADQCEWRRLSEYVALILVSDVSKEQPVSTLMRFSVQLKDVEMIYAHGSEFSVYVDTLQECIFKMCESHSNSMQQNYFTAVREDFPMPWCNALFQVPHEDANRWDQRRALQLATPVPPFSL